MPFPVLAVIAAAQAAYGIYQTVKANREKKKLGDYERYASPDKIINESRNASQGYTPAEKLAYFQALVKNNNMQYMNAMKSRPDMANTIQAGIDYGNIDAINKFAGNDAQLKRQDQQRLAGLYQGQDARNVNADNQRLLMREQALGQAKQAGVQNIFSGATALAQTYDNNSNYQQYLKSIGADGSNPNVGVGGRKSVDSSMSGYMNNNPDFGYNTQFDKPKKQNFGDGIYTPDYNNTQFYNPSYDNIANQYFRKSRTKSFNY
jgi:hypothetical protein